MKKIVAHLILFIGILSCKEDKIPNQITSEVVADGNELFYQFGSLSGHLSSLAFDKYGNLYVADDGNNVILKIDTTGKTIRFAGNGLYNHVDGRAHEASFLGPTGLVLDKQNNLYVSEANFIRKITPDAFVSTVAGSVLDNNTPNSKYKDGLALSSKFSNINSITIDSVGNIYASDSYNSVIRKLSNDGTVVTTFAGNGKSGYRDGINDQAEFNYPLGIAFNKNALYVADWNNFSVRKISNNLVSTVAGNNKSGFEDGYINNAKFRSPANLVFDEDGSLYIADTANQSIRKITTNGEVITLSTKNKNNSLVSPYGIALHKGNLYVTDGLEIIRILLN